MITKTTKPTIINATAAPNVTIKIGFERLKIGVMGGGVGVTVGMGLRLP
jgi:hypothetical protein